MYLSLNTHTLNGYYNNNNNNCCLLVCAFHAVVTDCVEYTRRKLLKLGHVEKKHDGTNAAKTFHANRAAGKHKNFKRAASDSASVRYLLIINAHCTSYTIFRCMPMRYVGNTANH